MIYRKTDEAYFSSLPASLEQCRTGNLTSAVQEQGSQHHMHK